MYRVLGVMYRHYTKCDCVVLNPPIQFGSNHSYDTRTPSYFCCISCCKTSFGQRFLDQELLIGETVYPLHYLMLYSELIFHGLYITIYFILDFCNSIYCVFYM